MKKLFILLFIIISKQSFACECVIVPLLTYCQQADFIATAKILKVSTDKENNQLNIISIELIEVYKGNSITTIKAPKDTGGNCGISAHANTTWLIFASYEKNGDLSFNACSGSIQMDQKYDTINYPELNLHMEQKIKFDLQILEFLKKENLMQMNPYGLLPRLNNNAIHSEFKGYEVYHQRFAIYEFEVRRNLSIKEIKPIIEFDNAILSMKLLDCLKKTSTVVKYKTKRVPSKSKLLVMYFYYPAQKTNESFISIYNL